MAGGSVTVAAGILYQIILKYQYFNLLNQPEHGMGWPRRQWLREREFRRRDATRTR
jgi:hypothetical protein